ncbi:hypothetical protein MTR_6g024130 [Medicago truncatula]|uniref:Uncharacterized protein n=1 Tax=Medicago truncatula TaxID=3880 RepID=A0A072U740_MEDTR|nr:hypothetical protein MTR_6g024130 [Medicago truncatula]
MQNLNIQIPLTNNIRNSYMHPLLYLVTLPLTLATAPTFTTSANLAVASTRRQRSEDYASEPSEMEDNDITRGSGRGVGIGINKVRGRGGAGSTDPTDRRIWIRLGPQLTFEPVVQPPRDSTKIMKLLFQGTWRTYREIKKYDKDLVDLCPKFKLLLVELKERLKTNEELIRASQEELRLIFL